MPAILEAPCSAYPDVHAYYNRKQSINCHRDPNDVRSPIVQRVIVLRNEDGTVTDHRGVHFQTLYEAGLDWMERMCWPSDHCSIGTTWQGSPLGLS
jgi:hypothetical protein